MQIFAYNLGSSWVQIDFPCYNYYVIYEKDGRAFFEEVEHYGPTANGKIWR